MLFVLAYAVYTDYVEDARGWNDIDFAFEQVSKWTADVAKKYGWADADDVASALEELRDDTYFNDVEAFLVGCRALFVALHEEGDHDGAADLAAVMDAALAAQASAEAWGDADDPWTIAGGTLAESAQDAKDAAKAAPEAINKAGKGIGAALFGAFLLALLFG